MPIETTKEIPTPVLRWVEALFRDHVDGVYNVAVRVLWNQADAEDVVQATFVKAFGRIDQLRDATKARSWLFQVAYREAITVIRRRRDVPTDPGAMPTLACPQPSPEDRAATAAVAFELSNALQQLQPDERMAVVLRDVEGLPMREVAGVLEIGESAAKMRVHRGRQHLRRLLAVREVR